MLIAEMWSNVDAPHSAPTPGLLIMLPSVGWAGTNTHGFYECSVYCLDVSSDSIWTDGDFQAGQKFARFTKDCRNGSSHIQHRCNLCGYVLISIHEPDNSERSSHCDAEWTETNNNKTLHSFDKKRKQRGVGLNIHLACLLFVWR